MHCSRLLGLKSAYSFVAQDPPLGDTAASGEQAVTVKARTIADPIRVTENDPFSSSRFRPPSEGTTYRKTVTSFQSPPFVGFDLRKYDLASLKLSLSWGALKLDAALASNASLFESDHLATHKR
jgi:hypothetical protein